MPPLNAPIEFEMTDKVLAVLEKMVQEMDHWGRECARLRTRDDGERRECMLAFLRSEPLAWYLMRLKDTGQPWRALFAAKEQIELICDRWNYRRKKEVFIDTAPYLNRVKGWHVRVVAASSQS